MPQDKDGALIIGDTVTYRTIGEDKGAIGRIAAKRPYLITVADVFRFCIHTIDAMDAANAALASNENPPFMTHADLAALHQRLIQGKPHE